MTNKMALLVAVVLGVFSILGIKLYVDKIKNEVERSQQFVEVLTASRDIKVGETIDSKDLERLKLPRPAVEAMRKTNIETAEQVIGAKTVADVRQGQILQTYHFTQSRKRAPLQVGGSDFRAVTIPVTPVTGVSGLVRPGDYVDVIVSMELKHDGPGGGTLHLARTLAKRALVLATDAFTDPHADNPLIDYATVTLKLNTADVNKVVLSVGRTQHIHLAKLDDSAAAAPTWDATTPDMLYREVEQEIKDARPK